MCQLCTITQNFDPVRHKEGGQFQTLSETADALPSLETTYTMAVGDSFRGQIERSGDRDWIAVELEAGVSYDIAMAAAPSGQGTLNDPYLQLYDANGELVGSDDDGGPGLESLLSYVARESGTFYIATRAFSVTDTGSYTVSVTQTATADDLAAGAGSLDQMADFLTDGYWRTQGTSERAFDSDVITVDITGLTLQGKTLARWAMQAWEQIADIRFEEVTRAAQITFDDNQSGAFASTFIDWNGGITSSTINVDDGWIRDYGATIEGYAFSTYIHEIGHALGLGHMGAYNGNAQYGSDQTFTNDSWQVSVMSYFNQAENHTVEASRASVITPMMADILAIQNLYGASQRSAGDTVWGPNATMGGYMGTFLQGLGGASTDGVYDGGSVAYTIFDAGGHDLWDLSHSSRAARVDMRAEQYSDVGGLVGNVGLARGTVIEDVKTGAGNDTITGNDANNAIHSGLGDDQIDAGAGDDLLEGGLGADVLFGRDGNDLIRGGGSEGQTFDWLYGGDGDDTLQGGFGFDQLFGEAGNDILNGGAQADNLLGGLGNDTLLGEGGLDRLLGGLGDDFIAGGDGNDGHFGQAGNDTMLGGAGNDRFFGGIGDDWIFGGLGDDTISADAGFDVLFGGMGNDLLSGRFNADRFVFADGHGQDTVTDFEARNDFEKIDLRGVSAITELADLLLSSADQGAARQVGADVVITTGMNSQIVLQNVSLNDLDAADFLF